MDISRFDQGKRWSVGGWGSVFVQSARVAVFSEGVV